MSDLLVTPSIPIHVADASSLPEALTVGTLQCASTLLNVDPVAMYPAQFLDTVVATAPAAWEPWTCINCRGAECPSPEVGLSGRPQPVNVDRVGTPAMARVAVVSDATIRIPNRASTVTDRRRGWDI